MARASSLLVVFLAVAGCAPEPMVPVVKIGGRSAEFPWLADRLQVAAPEPRSSEPEPDQPPKLAPVAPTTPVAADPPPLDVARDLRRGSRSPGPMMGLANECRLLESWLMTIAPGRTDERARLLYRLAMATSELAVSAQKAARPTFYGPARRRAILHYEALASQYPDGCVSASPAPCADEALYYLALELERDADLVRARQAYSTLVSKHPQSPFIPGAHLAFGEMFLAEALHDPSRLPLAEASYAQVLKYPPPVNALFGYAHHQLGRTRSQQGNRAGAAASFNAAIAWAATFAEAPGAREIAASAQRELGTLRMP